MVTPANFIATNKDQDPGNNKEEQFAQVSQSGHDDELKETVRVEAGASVTA